jgi:hypothetical protein
MSFGSRIVDDPAAGTFIAYAAFGDGPVIVGADSPKGDQLLLGSFGAGQTETVTPSLIQQVLAENGTLVLAATEKIIINSPFLPTQRGTLVLDAPRLFATEANGITSLQFAPNTIFDGVPLPEQVVPQMLDMVGVRQPQEGIPNVAYRGPMAPLCVTVLPDGGCETAPTYSPNDAVSARGNAYLGDLRLATPVPKSPDFSIPPNFPAMRLRLPPEPPPAP